MQRADESYCQLLPNCVPHVVNLDSHIPEFPNAYWLSLACRSDSPLEKYKEPTKHYMGVGVTRSWSTQVLVCLCRVLSNSSGNDGWSWGGFCRNRGPVHYLTSLQETRELATKLQDCSIQDWKRLEAMKPPDQDCKTGGKLNNPRSPVAPGGPVDICKCVYILFPKQRLRLRGSYLLSIQLHLYFRIARRQPSCQ